MRRKVLFIVGPTASGKTKLAVQKAIDLNGEIVSADSRQVYRRMDIGTGKDLAEYTYKGLSVKHHLIDICEPGEHYNINRFFGDAMTAIKDIWSRSKLPIVCGGSGLYLQTLMEGNPLSSIPVNPLWRSKAAEMKSEEIAQLFEAISDNLRLQLDRSTRKRQIRAIEIDEYVRNNGIPDARKEDYDFEIIGINPPRDTRRERISARLKARLEEGLITEVQKLLNEGITPDELRYYGLEYKWITDYLSGDISRDRLENGLESAIHRFAKRQMTWFRKMEREGYVIQWVQTQPE